MIDLLGAVGVWSGIVGSLFLILTVVACIVAQDSTYRNDDEKKPKVMKIAKQMGLFFLLCSTVSMIIPSKNTMYLMTAASWADKSQLPEKVVKALEVKLDKIIEGKE